jgi:hypothetical protein
MPRCQGVENSTASGVPVLKIAHLQTVLLCFAQRRRRDWPMV